MDEEETVHSVEFAGKEAEKLHLVNFFFKFGIRGISFFQKRFVFGGKFAQSVEIIDMFLKCKERFDDVFFGAEFLDRFLSFFLVIPEIGLRHDGFQVLDKRLMVRNLQKFR